MNPAGPSRLWRRLVRCLGGAFLFLAMLACAYATAPVTGRAQDVQVAFADMIAETAPEYDAYVERLQARRAVERRTPTARRVERIFRRLLPQALRLNPQTANLHWQVIVVKERPANFALPDGRILVSADWARHGRMSDSELAMLLAHEMAHVVCNHMLERVSALVANQPGRGGRIAVLLRQSREQVQWVREIAPLMRVQEIEADRVGAVIVGASGVPLAKAVGLFDHMARAEERAIGMAFVNSHDTALHRKAGLLEWAFSMDWRSRPQP